MVEQLTGNREGMKAKSLSWQGAEERMKPIELRRSGISSEKLYFFLHANDWIPHFVSPPDSGQAEETVCISSLHTAFAPDPGTDTSCSLNY